jgi:hypothetical protein
MFGFCVIKQFRICCKRTILIARGGSERNAHEEDQDQKNLDRSYSETWAGQRTSRCYRFMQHAAAHRFLPRKLLNSAHDVNSQSPVKVKAALRDRRLCSILRKSQPAMTNVLPR